jgi:hypothetical protein
MACRQRATDVRQLWAAALLFGVLALVGMGACMWNGDWHAAQHLGSSACLLVLAVSHVRLQLRLKVLESVGVKVTVQRLPDTVDGHTQAH